MKTYAVCTGEPVARPLFPDLICKVFIVTPPCRVGEDVAANPVQILLISHNVIEIVPFPNWRGRRIGEASTAFGHDGLKLGND